MKTCHVFCAASFTGLLEAPAEGDLILAADGGFRHTSALGIQPDFVLGDFDSLGYTPKGKNIQVFPVEKDDTDSMLAVRLGLSKGYERFIFYGALDGPRLDHTVANFQTLSFLASHGGHGLLVGDTYLATVLAPGEVRFSSQAEGILSLFCLGEPVEKITIEGLQYPLQDGRLTAHHPLGVSNHFIEKPSSIRWKEGNLLMLWDKAVGLPTYCPR